MATTMYEDEWSEVTDADEVASWPAPIVAEQRGMPDRLVLLVSAKSLAVITVALELMIANEPDSADAAEARRLASKFQQAGR